MCRVIYCVSGDREHHCNLVRHLIVMRMNMRSDVNLNMRSDKRTACIARSADGALQGKLDVLRVAAASGKPYQHPMSRQMRTSPWTPTR
jgi:hypothetical protein